MAKSSWAVKRAVGRTQVYMAASGKDVPSYCPLPSVSEHPRTPHWHGGGSLTSFHLALVFSFSNRRYSRRSSSSTKSRQMTRTRTPMRNTPAMVPPTIRGTLGGSGHSVGQTDSVGLQLLVKQRGWQPACGRAGAGRGYLCQD